MTGHSFVPLPGSERGSLPESQQLGAVDESQQIEVTLVTRRRAALPRDLVEGPATLTREQFAEQHGTDPADLDLITTVLAGHGLRVTSADAGARRVTVTGTIAALSATFGATLRLARSPDPVTGQDMVEHRYREGGLQIPAELNGIVLAVLGLDDRPQARAQFRRAPATGARATAPGSAAPAPTAPAPGGPPLAAVPAAAPTSYTPPQVAELYQFPAGTDGTGQTIAIIELGGGFGSSDLDPYFAGLGLPVPSVTAASVDGAVNQPGQDPSGADGEVLLDIEVAGGVAPGAAQVVYFAPNTDQGFVDAVTTAVHATPTPAVVSISWGQSEDSWTAQARTSLDQAMADAAALGVTITVAAGDNGSSDGQSGGSVHVDFPASSPHALACGGTSLRGNPTTGVISSETVWNDGASGGATGGGVSDTFGLPSWQATAGVPAQAGAAAGTAAGRGVPDVAGCADPATGYQVRVDGQSTVIGGTSAVAPLWAGLISRLVQSTGKPFGLMQLRLYAGVTAGTVAPGFRDVTSGSNGAYAAGPGWDACTGLGSPEGSALLAGLGSGQAGVTGA
ncbi:MAG TPA: S53 family peptidase [Streptosporangiaceae bacterium]